MADAALKSISKADLQEACTGFQIPKTGNKADLFSNLVSQAQSKTQKQIKDELKNSSQELVTLILEQKKSTRGKSRSRSPARTATRSPGRTTGKKAASSVQRRPPSSSPEPRRGRSPSPDSSSDEEESGPTTSPVAAASTVRLTPVRQKSRSQDRVSPANLVEEQTVQIKSDAEKVADLRKISFFRNPLQALQLALRNETLLIVAVSILIPLIILSLASGPHDEKVREFRTSLIQSVQQLRSYASQPFQFLSFPYQKWAGDILIGSISVLMFGVLVTWLARIMYARSLNQ